jgi:hypothetical protein
VPQKEIEAARIERGAEAASRRHRRQRRQRPEAAGRAGFRRDQRAHVVAGQVVEAREVLFEVVDPARLAVEALAYDPAQAADIAGATAPLPGAACWICKFVGAGRQLREQALPLLFRIKTKDAPVAVGQPLKVIAGTRRSQGRGLPWRPGQDRRRRGGGVGARRRGTLPLLRRVTVESLDAATVAVVNGLKNGDRVVTEGASHVSQVR